jgi:hypothetical protein
MKEENCSLIYRTHLGTGGRHLFFSYGYHTFDVTLEFKLGPEKKLTNVVKQRKEAGLVRGDEGRYIAECTLSILLRSRQQFISHYIYAHSQHHRPVTYRISVIAARSHYIDTSPPPSHTVRTNRMSGPPAGVGAPNPEQIAAMKEAGVRTTFVSDLGMGFGPFILG